MKYLYLHGLGQKPDSWDRVIKETTVSDRSASLSLAEMLEGKAATYRELYTAFSEECNKENDEIVLCGLSLGAVLALNYAIDHANKKASKELVSYLSNSCYRELLKTGHEANIEAPEGLAAVLQRFYDDIE